MHAKTCTTYKQVKLTTYAKSVSSSQYQSPAIAIMLLTNHCKLTDPFFLWGA